ncbi:MAG: hypothetical protein E6H79_14320 [Betaproteobacteria bacterium]|nr:MAG: hypothetical protein E6H79_14320 [Betaproteobacteria bacterium]
MPVPIAATIPPALLCALLAITPMNAPKPSAATAAPMTKVATSISAPSTSSGVSLSLKPAKRSPTSSAPPVSTLCAANSQPPIKTGTSNEAASEPSNGMTLSTKKMTSRIRVRTIHMPTFFVNIAQASVHQLIPRAAATARDSTATRVASSMPHLTVHSVRRSARALLNGSGLGSVRRF